MYYGSGTVAHYVTRARRASRQPANACGRRSKSMTSSKIQPGQLIRIYLNNNCAKFHPDPIWNDWLGHGLGFGPDFDHPSYDREHSYLYLRLVLGHTCSTKNELSILLTSPTSVQGAIWWGLGSWAPLLNFQALHLGFTSWAPKGVD